jgi:hypothetical protein
MRKNIEAMLLLIALLLFSFVAGCTTTTCDPNNPQCAAAGSGLSKKCTSDFCYCQKCDTDQWINVSKAANKIVTMNDCANYCAHYNVTKGDTHDKGYAFVCSDAAALIPPKCNCPPGTRCCQAAAVLATNKMQCIDDEAHGGVCPYAWAPDPLCNSE